MTDNPARVERRSTADILQEFGDYLDVPMTIHLEIGRRSMKVREILLLKPDSIVEIPKSVGENLDIYVNGRLIGFGEILEMEGKAGIRLTDFHVPNQ